MAKVFCEQVHDKHSFYMVDGSNEYYLFSQKYKKVVNQFYRNGVHLNKALKHGECKKCKVLHHTMNKLKSSIKYIEREYDISILNSTRRKRTEFR